MKSHLKKTLMILWVIQSFSVHAERPNWLDRPYQKKCKEVRELCAVGEGQSVLSAELSARAAIARMFQTQVKSATTVSAESYLTDPFTPGGTGEFEESIQEFMAQKTDFVLEGAKLLESYTGKNSVYALVTLNKKQAAKTFAEQIELLDTKNLELFKKKKRSALLQIEQNFKTRAQLHKYYRFLTDKTYPSPLPYQKVVEFKSELLKKDLTVLLDTTQRVPDELIHDIVSLLILHGYRVIEKEVKDHDYRLQVQLEIKKRHLNVKGFEKYAATLTLSVYTQHEKQLGQINLTHVEVGRSKPQVLEKTLKNYQEEIKEKFHQLKLD